MGLLDDCITDNLDVAKFNEQVRLHNEDIEHLDDLRESALQAIDDAK